MLKKEIYGILIYLIFPLHKNVLITLPLEFNSAYETDFDILFFTRTNKINELRVPFVRRGQRQARNCVWMRTHSL